MDKVICPWCGSEMEYIDVLVIGGNESSEYYYECPECEARSPLANSEEEALNAALSRPLQKPLTLEEAMEGKEPGVCAEYRVPGCIFYAFVSDSEFDGMCSIESIGRSTPCIAIIADYGKEWRCWAMKPTDEEREAAKWED